MDGNICFEMSKLVVEAKRVRCASFMILTQTCQPGECFRGTFRVKKRDLPAKSGTGGRAHIEIVFFRSIQPTEINCVPKYTVARRFGRAYRLVFLREIEWNFRNYVQ